MSERRGNAWSFLRSVLEQGRAIAMDDAAGKYPSYEHLSARIDEAARERADELLKLFSQPAASEARDAEIDFDKLPRSVIDACSHAIRREFGVHIGTDGYYKRIIEKIFNAMSAESKKP